MLLDEHNSHCGILIIGNGVLTYSYILPFLNSGKEKMRISVRFPVLNVW